MPRNQSCTTQFPKSVDPRQPKLSLYFATAKPIQKPSQHTTTVHQVHTAIAGKIFNQRLFSRSQSYRESNTSPLNAIVDKTIADWSHGQPSQSATPRFSSKEKYSVLRLKGLATDTKINRKTLHIWHILHRLHGKKKTKFVVRTLIQAYFQD